MFAIIGMVFKALVPFAMSTFGIIVPGMGTLHASYAAGGFAAFLQRATTYLLSFGL